MNNLVHTVADPDITDWLLRLDVATVVLMTLLCIHYIGVAYLERHHGLRDRTLQGIVLVAALAGWAALELFWISMSRAALLTGMTDPEYVSSAIRLLVPLVGLGIAAGVVWWSSEVRRWQVIVGAGIAVFLLTFPQPYQWFAVLIYQLLPR